MVDSSETGPGGLQPTVGQGNSYARPFEARFSAFAADARKCVTETRLSQLHFRPEV